MIEFIWNKETVEELNDKAGTKCMSQSIRNKIKIFLTYFEPLFIKIEFHCPFDTVPISEQGKIGTPRALRHRHLG